MIFRDIEEYNEESGELEVIVEADEKRAEFVNWVLGEMKLSEENLAGRHSKLNKFRLNREGMPIREKKNSPRPNSSNMVVPMTMSMVQTVYGEVKNTFALRDPFWIAKPMHKEPKLVEQARVLTNYYGLIADSPTDLDLRNNNKTIIYDACSLGTCFVKYPYMEKSWNIMQQDESGTETKKRVVSHDGLAVIPYPEEAVLYATGATNLQESPWVSFTDSLFECDLLLLGANGTYTNVDRVIEGGDGEAQTKKENWIEEAKRAGIDIDTGGMFDIAEVYAFYDVNGDGEPEDIIVTIHVASGTVLREEFNQIGRRPIGVAKYMPVPYQMGGRGVCCMTERLQEEIDGTHNMRIDYNKFAMNPPIKVRNGSGLGINQNISLGQILPVDEMDDLQPMQLFPLQYASITEENLCTNYAQRATGVSEIMQGFADSTLKSRDTLGGQTLRLQQGKGMFGSVINGMQDFYSEMGQIMFYQMVHNREKIIEKESKLGRMSEEDIGLLNDVLNIPLDEIPMRLQFLVRTRNVEETKDVQQKNYLMLTQLISQHTQQVAQGLMMVNNPQQPVPEPVRDAVMKGIEASSRILEGILELINIDNTEDYLISGDHYEMMEKQRKAQMQMQQMMAQQLQNQQMMQLQGQGQGGQGGLQNTGRVPGGVPGGPDQGSGQQSASESYGPGERDVTGGNATPGENEGMGGA